MPKAEPVGAELTGVIIDRGIDTDGDGIFEYLEIGVEVNVTEAGEYIIEVQGLSDTDVYIGVGNSTRNFIDVGIRVFNVRLDGPTIFASGHNPARVSNVVLFDEFYNYVDHLSDVPLSRGYVYTEFDAPGAALTGAIYDRGVDIDGNGVYDYLEVGVQVNVTKAGGYQIEIGGLTADNNEYIWVANVTQYSLDVGIQVVNIRLDGQAIFASGLNPINVSGIVLRMYPELGLWWSLSNVPLSRGYVYTEFDAPGAALTGAIFDRGIDVDGNGLFDFLEVGVEVNVTEAGEYKIAMYELSDNQRNLIYGDGGNVTQYSLDVGIQVVNIRLDGQAIFASGLNPINVSGIVLQNSMYTVLDSLSNVPLSKEYSSTEFEGPADKLTGVIIDRGIDTDEDGIFEYMEIGVEVNVTEAGTYIVEVQGLMTNNNSYIDVRASKSMSLNVGSQVVLLQINGMTIFASGQNPVKVSKVVLYDEFHNHIGSRTLALSRTYSYTEFGKPPTVGVKVGDWAKWNVSSTWQSTDPNATKPPQFEGMQTIEWIRINVQDVSNTNITVLLSYHFENGTEQTSPLISADIAKQFMYFIIPSNLNVTDVIPGTRALNGTAIRSYAGMNRNVNYIGSSSVMNMMQNMTQIVVNMTQTFYWDKATGILCEWLTETHTLKGNYITTISNSIVITETNMWLPLSTPITSTSETAYPIEWIIGMVATIVIVIAIVALILRRRKESLTEEDA